MIPISSSRSAASLENAACSPAKNFWLACLVLPAQIFRRIAELLAGLLHVGAHDLVGLLLVALDHLERVEIALGQRLHGRVVLGDEFRRAAERVHHHRIIERGGDDLAGLRLVAHRREIGLVGHRDVVLSGDEGLRGRSRLHVDDGHVLHAQAVLLQEPGEREIGRGAGRGGRDLLALDVLDRRDAVAHHHAVGAVGLVELEHLRGRDAVRVPHDPGLDRGGGALHVARRDREMAARLRDLLDRHVEAVLGEDAGLLGERERREAGPARNADRDLGLRQRGRGKHGRAEHGGDHGKIDVMDCSPGR